MSLVNYGRSYGFGGLVCGGLAGLLFLLYPDAFPRHSTQQGVMLVGACLGAGFQRVACALVFKPFGFYARLAQLRLLRRCTKKQTYEEILRRLIVEYFLGTGERAAAPPRRDEEPDGPAGAERREQKKRPGAGEI